RHALHYADVAARGEPALRGPEQGLWLAWLATEGGNLRAAVQWCQGNAAGHGDVGLRLVGSLGWFWYFAAAGGDGSDAVAAMLAAVPGAPQPERALALQSLSVVSRPRSCLVHPSDYSGRAAQESLEMFERL